MTEGASVQGPHFKLQTLVKSTEISLLSGRVPTRTKLPPVIMLMLQ